MLRVESETGWWLITHRDHARLAADFAEHWGNHLFAPPHPRSNVLHGIRVHDDGWIARDASPCITKEGKPSAFSTELVGKYSAFEEIDLSDYLAVRESALLKVQRECAYAALLVSLHTYNLLTQRADRSTISAAQLPLLDAFLKRQLEKQHELRARIRDSGRFSPAEASEETIQANFRLLQAVDNLSLYSCVGYKNTGNLLHPLLTNDGSTVTVQVYPAADRHYRLEPYPFHPDTIGLTVAARHVTGRTFDRPEDLQQKYSCAEVQQLNITLTP